MLDEQILLHICGSAGFYLNEGCYNHELVCQVKGQVLSLTGMKTGMLKFV
jgi:hypothetical protein